MRKTSDAESAGLRVYWEDDNIERETFNSTPNLPGGD